MKKLTIFFRGLLLLLSCFFSTVQANDNSILTCSDNHHLMIELFGDGTFSYSYSGWAYRSAQGTYIKSSQSNGNLQVRLHLESVDGILVDSYENGVLTIALNEVFMILHGRRLKCI